MGRERGVMERGKGEIWKEGDWYRRGREKG